jgi:hypothetical protein
MPLNGLDGMIGHVDHRGAMRLGALLVSVKHVNLLGEVVLQP